MVALVERLSAYVEELPPVGADALRTARSYWQQSSGQPDDLLTAKVACWAYLDAKHGTSMAIVDREDRLLRAMLCVLEPVGDEEKLFMTTEWFEAMMSHLS